MNTVTAPPPAPTVAGEVEPPAPRVRSWWARALITVFVGAFVLATGAGVFNFLTSLKQEPPRQENGGVTKTYSVTVFHVKPVTLQRVITAFGTAIADREVIISAEVSGQIIEANQLEVGRKVSPPEVRTSTENPTAMTDGDLLVRIDPRTYEQRVQQARELIAQDAADLDSLDEEDKKNRKLLSLEKENRSLAQAEYDNATRLRERGVGTESAERRAKLEFQQYEDAVTRLDNELQLYDERRKSLAARQRAHESDLKLAELDLSRTQVRPPFAGALSEVYVEEGQYVRPGDPLVQLTDPTRVEIPLSLTLSDYLAIADMRDRGRSLQIALAENETSSPRWFSDPIEPLRQAPKADETTRTVNVYTEVDNREQSVPLLPGTFVHARIPGPVLSNAIAVPRDAVVEGTVFVAVPEETDAGAESDSWFAHVERRSITPASVLQSLVLVDQGLTAGDWVVTTNLDVIFDGARLKIEQSNGERHLIDELADLRTPQVKIIDDHAASTRPAGGVQSQ